MIIAMSNNISKRKREAVFNKYNGRCDICGKQLDLEYNGVSYKNYMCIDHIRPRSLGGTNDISNLRALCSRCNSSRGNYSGEKLLDLISSKMTDAIITHSVNYERLKDDIKLGQISNDDIEFLIESTKDVCTRNLNTLYALQAVIKDGNK